MNQHPFEHPLRMRPEALADLRSMFREWLRARRADEDAVSDLTVVLSELGANAIEASTSDDRHGRVRAWCEGEHITIEVENDPHSASVESVVLHTDEDPLRGSGQGLGIVAAFTDSMEILPPNGANGLTVRCRRRVPGLHC